MKNVANWEVNISGYSSHIISVIAKKKKLKKKTEKKNLEPDSNLTGDSNLIMTRDSKSTRAINDLEWLGRRNIWKALSFCSLEVNCPPFSSPVPQTKSIQSLYSAFSPLSFEPPDH